MPQPKDKDWLNGYKKKTPIYAVYKRPTSNSGTHTDWKWRAGKDISCKLDQKKSGVTILISDKIDFKIKAMKRDKEGHYIMIKGSIQEEYITIINIYAPNIGALQYVKQILIRMKGEINNNTIIAGEFNTLLSPMYRKLNRKLIRKHKL